MNNEQKHPILQKLEEYFKNTPKEQIDKDWSDILKDTDSEAYYEERYKHALARAKELSKTVTGANYEYIFPELKESEDGRIKQEILHYIKSYAKLREEKIPTEWFEYLEKQGEQKPTDKIEPKFKVGDWIVNNVCLPMQIASIKDGMYIFTEGDAISVSFIDENYHLWTIKDAKEGDVLANDHHILILKELVYNWSSNGTPHSVKAYCGIKPNGNFEIGKDNWCFCGTLHVHPATKEQRELLFRSMKESYYEWDAEKKELKKMEVASKESEDEKIRKVLVDYFNHHKIGINIFYGVKGDDIIAWLEKQGFSKEQTNLPCFTFDDVLALQCCMETVKKVQEDEELYRKLNDLHSKVYDAYQLEKQGERKSTEDTKKLDADKVIAWLVANVCNFEYYVSLFKQDFKLWNQKN